MEILLALDYVRLSAFAVLLLWVIGEFLTLKEGEHEAGSGVVISAERKGVTLLPSHIISVCNALITSIHIGFAVLGVWKHQTISLGFIFASLSWILVTLFSVYCKHKGAGLGSNWPAVLVYWWVFSSLLESLLTSLHLLHLINSATVVNFTSLPFCAIICLCLLAIAMRTSEANQDELNQPLLTREDSGDSRRDRFSSSRWWSQLTFQWLNPVFEKGHHVRLEIEHIPAVPQSETADQSYALLQETMHKQKTEPMSLQKGIICAVWTPLVINAVFAGLNTLASYMGPFLITYLVKLLSDKNPDRGHGHGYMLASLFFVSKTVESLSQRQWYFGARRIGFRVRAALMVSIYKKSLLIKDSPAGTGRIVNFLDVDVEKIGEFFWYIHGIWLLPLQVSLALVILYHSLGMAASLSAVFATVLIMVSNTPLDKLLKLRDVERGLLRRYLYTCSAIAFLFWASPTLVSVVTFGICILVDIPLSAGTVLSALATFRILQDPISWMIPSVRLTHTLEHTSSRCK